MNAQNADREAIAREADRRLLDGALARLGATGSPLLRSLAGDVRSGRLTLSEVARKQEVAAPFTAAVAKYQKWQQGLTDRERKILQDEVARRIKGMRERIANERETS